MRVLVFGDTHEPYSIKGYIPWLLKIKEKWRCNKIVHVGDLVDFHAISPSHDPDPSAMDALSELERAIENLKLLFKAFPSVTFIPGNHDLRLQRAAAKMRLPQKMIVYLDRLLEFPKRWDTVNNCIIDDVFYSHGEGYSGKDGARNCAIDNRMSAVIGHLHSFAGINWLASRNDLIFGFNVGSLIDNNAPAFKYGINMRHKPIISAGVIIDGKPYLETMNLGTKIKRR